MQDTAAREPLSAEERARRAAAAMWAEDRASQWLGFELVEVGPGRATLAMTVAPHHANGHGICHGGIIFSLADSAFAFACNSYNRNAVAQHNVISYIAPGRVGDRLTARAREISLRGRSGLYDVTVTDQNGQLIADFRGASRIIAGQHFPENSDTTATEESTG
ncbi:acyl-CoA thioesterase [Meinhardsimonia xiamenensis]|jgi:acyl-CoA thioesterase|uniref:Acyl-CoA thioesterase n=1 Tax=Meinhardsimonia xiamenensis TaxID=990712 RepID=A0A1G9FHA0_9RHOB|nr:acyl-CoA thioesterase [Meinhardsimonia xiamenensis]SDK87784.1 acyl-CoA thioesterase [Meinhardsimonia xiamenensis]